MSLACGANHTEMLITPRNNTAINSPGFPEGYPELLHCKWHIMADDGYRIELQLQDGELEEKCVNLKSRD